MIGLIHDVIEQVFVKLTGTVNLQSIDLLIIVDDHQQQYFVLLMIYLYSHGPVDWLFIP